MELPVVDFIRQIISEANPKFETRSGTAYYDMFVTPQQLMLQPLSNTMNQLLVSQSVRKILQQPSPDTYSTDDVDDLVANVYVTRDAGAYSTGSVRVYYAEPLAKDFTAYTAEFTSGSLSFFNSTDISISATQMALQTEGSLYYMDVLVRSQFPGLAYKVDAEMITAFVNDTDAVRVTNLVATQSGRDAETNTQLLVRAQNSIGVRDLETVKGINAILSQNFTFISSINAIGMGDPEMQRDIVYNTHVGGKTDVYIKTPSLTTASKNFVGLDYDYTREISRDLHVQMAKSAADIDNPPDTGTPQIISNSEIVREDVVETAATVSTVTIPTSTGIDLSDHEYIKLQIDGALPHLIRIAGAFPEQTQKFEILNSINAALGMNLATVSTNNTLRLTSPTLGALSTITIMTVGSGYNEGAYNLFDITGPLPVTYSGTYPEVYRASSDYYVDYSNGLIYQRPFATRTLPTILSNQTMIDHAQYGKLDQIGSNIYFSDSLDTSKFYKGGPPPVKVRLGDAVTIHSIAIAFTKTGDTTSIGPSTNRITNIPITTGIFAGMSITGTGIPGGTTVTAIISPTEIQISNSATATNTGITFSFAGDKTNATQIGDLPQTYTVSTILGGDITVSDPKLTLLGLSYIGPFPILNITYSIKSNQVVIVDYKYHPISIDIGGQVLLSDGLTRGIRPGRSAFTLTDTPFIRILSIAEIDPQSGEVIGDPLTPPEGYGYGGYGEGGYGMGVGGDYEFRVMAPRDRYSVFDAAVILFSTAALTLSYKVTYEWVPELVTVHNLCRKDNERVTGADVLPRSYVPCFVDMDIGIVRDATNLTTPANANLALLVQNYVNGRAGTVGVLESDIVKLLEDQGLTRVSTPFVMTGTILNTDSSTQIIQDTDILRVPDIVLESDTEAYATKNIVFFFPGTITIKEVV